jgi:hypothetical protein
MSSHHAAQLAALDVLQRMLSRLYGLDAEGSVAPFLLDPATLEDLRNSGAVQPRQGAREEVFVLDQGGDLSVALWLDERALEAASDAANDDDSVTLSAEDFPDFCVALEGVSHLVLMDHRVGMGLPVTQLELELQAEVDKYVLARLSPWRHSVPLSVPGEEPRVTASVRAGTAAPELDTLEGALFETWQPAENLVPEQVERYRTATHYAHRYCRHLERRFLAHRRGDALRSEMRAFYRMGQTQRLEHIARR